MEDAIRIIEGLDTSNSEENIKAKKMAVAAMKKQIPQRPVEHFTGNEWECKCPVCGGITDTPTEVIEECIQYCVGVVRDWIGVMNSEKKYRDKKKYSGNQC